MNFAILAFIVLGVGFLTYTSVAELLIDLKGQIDSLHEKIDKFTAEKKEEVK